MKRIYLTLIFTVLLAFSTFAQQNNPVMSFDVVKHDFGNITQEDGLAKITFEFTNTGGGPIIINDVKSSCGCTTPTWTKEPVGPGAKGIVEAAYDPRNRPGHFSKTITVYSNADNSPITLTITGNVTEKQSSVEESYPQKVGELRLDQIYLNFGNTYSDQKDKKMELKTYNPTTADIKIQVEDSYKPAYTSIKVTPEILKPGQEGKIEVTYDASKVNDWDYVRGYIYLTLNGQRNTATRLQVSAIIKEKFTAEQLLHPPKIEFDETSFDFGTINEGDVIVHEFTYTNTGDSDLLIRKTKSSCGCTAVTLSKEPIKPGGKGTVKATFNTTHKKNSQTKTITIITNCPDEKYNKIVLKLTGFVTPAE
ncbi:MAG: DUF1573 domain-containing protein [Bacteroidales bacterium]|nr:DUF1573 domain-containing protein [Bacteroidales bacterium]